jgi:hypothetical protein
MTAKKKSKNKKQRKSKPAQPFRRKPVEKIFNLKIRQSSGDLVQIQISARLKKVPKGFKITRELLSAFIREKAEKSRGQWMQKEQRVRGAFEGPNPPGIELKIIRWRNPNRKDPSLRGWRYGTQADAWGSLRRPLQLIGF